VVANPQLPVHHNYELSWRAVVALNGGISVMILPVGPPRCQIASHLTMLHEGRGFLGEFGCIYPHKNLKGRGPSIYRSQGLCLVSKLQAQGGKA